MSKLVLDYPAILNLFKEHVIPLRSESAAFLIWYLQNYYRLDEVDAVDSVCDQSGDKGIDGIYVNEAEGTIDVFQSRISQRSDVTVGDTRLKEFAGALSQLKDRAALENLVRSAGATQIAQLVSRLDLLNKINSYEVRGLYLSNIDIDANGQAFINGGVPISFVGRARLQDTYVSDQRTPPGAAKAAFDVAGFRTAEYIVDANTRAIIAPIRARELVALQGLADQSLFDFNVRGPLGHTQVNRDIVRSIKDPTSHKFFPLFHNGVTIICERLIETKDRIQAENYFVVNGCQSLNSLYDNKGVLTDDLRLLTKFVQMDVASDLSARVTKYSNNQNGVKARDFKSNHPIHIRLQNEMRSAYSGKFDFEIKRGENVAGGRSISNEDAGLYFLAFDLREPWATHRKYQVFDEKHAEVFGRPEVTADRIVMLDVAAAAILRAGEHVKNRLFGKYALTKYALLFMLRDILEKDEMGQRLMKDPKAFVRDDGDRARFSKCIDAILGDVVVDVNAEVQEYGEEFDYRGKLRDTEWVKDLAKKVTSNYEKLVKRSRVESFGQLWERLKSEDEAAVAGPSGTS